jgi:hypothetical protein
LFSCHQAAGQNRCVNVETNYVKNAVFWDVLQWGCCKNRRFRGTHLLYHQGDKNRVRFSLRLTVSQSVCLGIQPRLGLMTRCWLIV